jgi:hypothetical protein
MPKVLVDVSQSLLGEVMTSLRHQLNGSRGDASRELCSVPGA